MEWMDRFRKGNSRSVFEKLIAWNWRRRERALQLAYRIRKCVKYGMNFEGKSVGESMVSNSKMGARLCHAFYTLPIYILHAIGQGL